MEREKFVVFNTPTYIYEPYDSVEKLTLRKTGTVYMNEYLGVMGANKKIYSPVSGRIIGTKKTNVNNSLANTSKVPFKSDKLTCSSTSNPSICIN